MARMRNEAEVKPYPFRVALKAFPALERARRRAGRACVAMSAKRKAEALIPAEESDQLLIRPL